MTTDQRIDSLVSSLDEAVTSGLAYFEGPGSSAKVRVGTWEPREVLCHLIYWCQANLEGMESVAAGGSPTHLYASVDEMNARAVGRASGKSIEQLAQEMRDVHQRLITAARNIPDPDATVLTRSDGTTRTVAQSLERLANHWNEHVAELKSLQT